MNRGLKKFQVSIKIVLHNPKNDTFLMAQRMSTKEWGLFGGTIVGDENIAETLVREVKEEMGSAVIYNVGDIIYAKRRRIKGQDDFLKIAYLATYKGGKIILSQEHSKCEWVRAEKIIKGQYTDWVKESIAQAQNCIKLYNKRDV
jgi:8-oxo-dGTP pyrophosphatase MutT (NUDIX family)